MGVLDCEEMAWDQAALAAMFIMTEDALAALSEACGLVVLRLRVGGARASANHLPRRVELRRARQPIKDARHAQATTRVDNASSLRC